MIRCIQNLSNGVTTINLDGALIVLKNTECIPETVEFADGYVLIMDNLPIKDQIGVLSGYIRHMNTVEKVKEWEQVNAR